MGPPSEPSDAELMRRLAGGGLDALGVLYERHWRTVLSVLSHRLRDRAAAEDALSEVFLTLPGAARRYQETGSFRGFLAGIALRKVLEHGRRGRLQRLLGALWGQAQPESVESAGAAEARLELEGLFAGLSEGAREVLLLRMVNGLEAAEIAAALGINEKTVWTRVHRARAELKRLQEAKEGKGG